MEWYRAKRNGLSNHHRSAILRLLSAISRLSWIVAVSLPTCMKATAFCSSWLSSVRRRTLNPAFDPSLTDSVALVSWCTPLLNAVNGRLAELIGDYAQWTAPWRTSCVQRTHPRRGTSSAGRLPQSTSSFQLLRDCVLGFMTLWPLLCWARPLAASL